MGFCLYFGKHHVHIAACTEVKIQLNIYVHTNIFMLSETIVCVHTVPFSLLGPTQVQSHGLQLGLLFFQQSLKPDS